MRYPQAFVALAVSAAVALAGPALAGIPGDLDTSFSGNGKVTTDFTPGDDGAFTLAIQDDGKIVAGGASDGPNVKQALARYNVDGTLDDTFSGNGKVTTDFGPWADDAFGVVIQDDGRIVAAGDADFCFDGCNPKFGVARYNPDGTLDTAFSGNGKVKTDITPGIDGASYMVIQPDGKLVVSGGADIVGPHSKFALVRYNTDGTLDASFGGDGRVTTNFTTGQDSLLGASSGVTLAGSPCPATTSTGPWMTPSAGTAR